MSDVIGIPSRPNPTESFSKVPIYRCSLNSALIVLIVSLRGIAGFYDRLPMVQFARFTSDGEVLFAKGVSARLHSIHFSSILGKPLRR